MLAMIGDKSAAPALPPESAIAVFLEVLVNENDVGVAEVRSGADGNDVAAVLLLAGTPNCADVVAEVLTLLTLPSWFTVLTVAGAEVVTTVLAGVALDIVVRVGIEAVEVLVTLIVLVPAVVTLTLLVNAVTVDVVTVNVLAVLFVIVSVLLGETPRVNEVLSVND